MRQFIDCVVDVCLYVQLVVFSAELLGHHASVLRLIEVRF